MGGRISNLDRRFAEWNNPDFSAYEMELLSEHGGPDFGWENILEWPRVVVLAEAGAGKSSELDRQWKRLRAEGRSAFFATVQDVGHRGLRDAVVSRSDFDAWKAGDGVAWFFLDSVDEALLREVPLGTALRSVARDIDGVERRARIVLSCRYTDWDFDADRAAFEDILPYETDGTRPSEEQLLMHVLHGERLPDPPGRAAAAVLLMQSLDPARVRIYAADRDIGDLDAFLEAVDAGGLWRFVRRPLDLDWMAAYWKRHGRFDNYATMLAEGVDHRLDEWKRGRDRGDDLDPAGSRRALERIGAAMTFARAEILVIPKSGPPAAPDPGALDLRSVFPERSPEDVLRLIGRPVFDPATLGRCRLHNDNDGAVRAFLTARWLSRLRSEGCDARTIHDLLFADVYGNALIRPGARLTAAWLALWDRESFQEVIARAPSLLMNEGDPSSLSVEDRSAVLEAVARELEAGSFQRMSLDDDKLRRFADPSLSETVRRLWDACGGRGPVRGLLLRLIALGRMRDCADIAVGAALDDDPRAKRYAIDAAAEMGDEDGIGRIIARVGVVDPAPSAQFVWSVVEWFFPERLSLRDLLTLLDHAPRERHLDFRYMGEDAARRIGSATELSSFVEALLDWCRRIDEPRDRSDQDSEEGRVRPALILAANRLVETSPITQAPRAAMDAFLWAHRDVFARRGGSRAEDALRSGLCASAPRRRALFWRAAENPFGTTVPGDGAITDYWALEFVGWPRRLEAEDMDWLVEDISGREALWQRQLALDVAHHLHRQAEMDGAALETIARAARTDETLANLHRQWLAPPPESPELRQMREENAALSAGMEAERVRGDEAARLFVEAMRAEPSVVRAMEMSAGGAIDSRLVSLWELARVVCAKNGRYSFDGLQAIEPLFGRDLNDALRAALSRFWRRHRPSLPCRAPGGAPTKFDAMAIAGIGVEALADRRWAEGLSEEEGSRAAEFATLELNGLPPWLHDLLGRHSRAVQDVLTQAIIGELDDPSPETPGGARTLYAVTRSNDAIVSLVAPALMAAIEARARLKGRRLDLLLAVLARGLPNSERQRFLGLCLDRAQNAPLVTTAGRYAATAFVCDPAAACEAVTRRLDALSRRRRYCFVTTLLPKLVGSGHVAMHERLAVGRELPLDVLKRLVEIAFDVVRVEDDVQRQPFEVYSVTARDGAEGARGAAFRRLCAIPGPATYRFLMDSADEGRLPIEPQGLRAMALDRASEDAELEPWEPGAAANFEREWERAPRTGLELQQLLLRRFEDIQHDLREGDFNQAQTLKRLESEFLVQNWVAQVLRYGQRAAFGIEREPERADRKRPDIAARAKASDENVPIEIKIVEDWSIDEIMDGLHTQLRGRYLRAKTSHFGILLLVHKNAPKTRPKRWRAADGAMIGFPALVSRVKSEAEAIARSSGDAPRPAVAVLDVSDVPLIAKVSRDSAEDASDRKRKAAVHAGKRAPRRKAPAAGRSGTKKAGP